MKNTLKLWLYFWQTACAVREHRKRTPIRAGNKKIHRYAGFLKCADCGGSFTSKKRKLDNIEYMEYICTTYNRHGLKYCSSHRIREEELDRRLYAEMARIKSIASKNLKKVDEFIEVWTNQKNNHEQLTGKFQVQVAELSANIKSLILEQAKNPQRAGLIEEVIKDCEKQMAEINVKIEKLKTPENIDKTARANIKNSIEILEEIIMNKSIDNAHLHMVLCNISVSQPDGGENINLEFELKAPLKTHTIMNEFILTGISEGDDTVTEHNAS